MKNIKIEGGIWANYKKYNKQFEYVFYSGRMESEYLSSQGFIPIAPYEIEIEIPVGVDLHKCALVSLQNKRKLILAKNQSDLNNIDAEIQEFMAIENKEV